MHAEVDIHEPDNFGKITDLECLHHVPLHDPVRLIGNKAPDSAIERMPSEVEYGKPQVRPVFGDSGLCGGLAQNEGFLSSVKPLEIEVLHVETEEPRLRGIVLYNRRNGIMGGDILYRYHILFDLLEEKPSTVSDLRDIALCPDEPFEESRLKAPAREFLAELESPCRIFENLNRLDP